MLPKQPGFRLSDRDVQHVGRVALSPSRRLAIVLRAQCDQPEPVLDLRVQILADGRWQRTGQAIAIEADRLPELLAVLQAAALEPTP